jgi:peptidoglycan hydrolase CwlO-like protein
VAHLQEQVVQLLSQVAAAQAKQQQEGARASKLLEELREAKAKIGSLTGAPLLLAAELLNCC